MPRVKLKNVARIGRELPRELLTEVDDVHPESRSASIQPKAYNVVDRCSHFEILPIQIRLLHCE
jgi:hypothetical protein